MLTSVHKLLKKDNSSAGNQKPGGFPMVLFKTSKSDKYFSPSQTKSLFNAILIFFMNFACKKSCSDLSRRGQDSLRWKTFPKIQIFIEVTLALISTLSSRKNCLCLLLIKGIALLSLWRSSAVAFWLPSLTPRWSYYLLQRMVGEHTGVWSWAGA